MACILAAVATAIDPPILQATSSAIQGALRVEPEGAAQLVGVYYMIQAGVMVAGGVLGDRFGLRRVLLIGLAGMLASALVTAWAQDGTVIVAGHVGLSLSTAVVVPLSLAGVMRTFAARVMPVAIALYLTIQLIAALVGPMLAQALFDVVGFGATLLPAILATCLAIIGVRRWLPETRPGRRLGRLDTLALTFWSLGMLLLVYGTVAFVIGWGDRHEVILIVGALCLFGAISRVARDGRLHLPDVPFRVIGVTLFLGAILGLVQSGSLLQLSTYLKGVLGYGDLASGVALAPFALGILIASVGTGVALARRYHGTPLAMRVVRRPIAIGFVLVSLSALLMGLLQEDSGYLLIGSALGLLGAGAGMANVPRTDLLFQSVEQDHVGVAAGLNGSSFMLGEALGNVGVSAMIALTSAAAWQQRLVDGGMSSSDAMAAVERAQQAIFLATAHPFVHPSYLDIAAQVPGWDVVFTEAFTAAMLGFGVIAAVGAIVASVALRLPPAGPTGDAPATAVLTGAP